MYSSINKLIVKHIRCISVCFDIDGGWCFFGVTNSGSWLGMIYLTMILFKWFIISLNFVTKHPDTCMGNKKSGILCYSCTTGGSRSLERGGATWWARSANLYGSLRAEPSVGSRGKAPGQGVRGQSPPEADDIFTLEGQFKQWKLHPF